MLWSQTTIPAKPRLLVVDGSRNHQGWEAEFCSRIFNVLGRKGMNLVGEGPLKADRPQDLSEALSDQGSFNCIFLVGHGAQVPEESNRHGRIVLLHPCVENGEQVVCDGCRTEVPI